MDVVLLLARELVVDDERHLLNVNAAGEQVRANEHANRTLAEIIHTALALLHIHLPVDEGEREPLRDHLLCQPLRPLTLITVDERLADCELLIQITENIILPLLALQRHAILLDAIQGHRLGVHKNPHRIAENEIRHLNDIRVHRG